MIGAAEVVVLIGLASLGYGLYLLAPWVCFAVCGVITIGLGVALGYTQASGKSKNQGG